jgi:hypothetical protein
VEIMPPSEIMAPAVRAAIAGGDAALSAELQLVAVTDTLRIGIIGNVALTVWSVAASVQSFDTLAEQAPTLVRRCGGTCVKFAIVEPSARPPAFAARKKLLAVMEGLGPYLLCYAGVLLGGSALLAQPIMNGLALLARPRFPMAFFRDPEPAAQWVSQHWARGPDGPLSAAEIGIAADLLRRLRR